MLTQILSSSLFRSAGIYTVSNALTQGLPFFLLPILTHYLDPEEYGILSMFQVVVGIATPIISLNIHGAIHRQYYERENIDFSSYIGSCLILLSTATLASFFFVSSGAPLLYRFTHISYGWLLAAIIFTVSQVIIFVQLGLWQGEVRSTTYGIFQFGRTLVNVGLSLLLVIVYSLGWQGRILGQTVANSVFALLAILLLYKSGWIKLTVRFKYIKHALKFGAPLIPHTLSVFLISMTDRIFITNMVGLADTGIYTVGYQVGMVIGLMAVSFNTAYVPWLFRRLKTDRREDRLFVVRFTYGYFMLLLIGVATLSWVGPLGIRVLMGAEYGGATGYVFWCALGYAFNGMYLMVTAYIFYSEKTHLLVWVTFLAAALNAVLNYLLIKVNGPLGAAQATTVTFAVKFLLTWYLSWWVCPMPWKCFGATSL